MIAHMGHVSRYRTGRMVALLLAGLMVLSAGAAQPGHVLCSLLMGDMDASSAGNHDMHMADAEVSVAAMDADCHQSDGLTMSDGCCHSCGAWSIGIQLIRTSQRMTVDVNSDGPVLRRAGQTGRMLPEVRRNAGTTRPHAPPAKSSIELNVLRL